MDIHNNYVRCIELYLPILYRYLYFGVTKTLLFCLSPLCVRSVLLCVFYETVLKQYFGLD